jgi:cell division protein FtsZ
MADQVLYSGVACITDLMVKEGLINLDFADVRAVMREMGKAMMGTGEAGGEKRALTAAEAAIANPLIDDSSMRGAKGLLISITGGKDLTLFEVDEAATRIREEVDQDANIIVGATFDESLEGIIRVSVVATGIDNAEQMAARNKAAAAQAAAAPAPVPENRLADLTARLRADTAKMAERVAHQPPPRIAEPAPRAPVEQDRATLAAVAAAVAPAPAHHAPVHHAPAAPATYGDVSIRPVPPKPTLFAEPKPEPVEMHDAPPPAAFIPPAAEKMPPRPARMPKFEELPLTAQNEIRQARGEVVPEHPQKTRMSLLQRLANVGLGRRDEETEPPIAARGSGPAMPVMPQGQPPRMPMPHRPAPQQRPAEPVSEYARRSPPQGLDSHGRPAPVASPPPGEDHLDIPAFLRRQNN